MNHNLVALQHKYWFLTNRSLGIQTTFMSLKQLQLPCFITYSIHPDVQSRQVLELNCVLKSYNCRRSLLICPLTWSLSAFHWTVVLCSLPWLWCGASIVSAELIRCRWWAHHEELWFCVTKSGMWEPEVILTLLGLAQVQVGRAAAVLLLGQNFLEHIQKNIVWPLFRTWNFQCLKLYIVDVLHRFLQVVDSIHDNN